MKIYNNFKQSQIGRIPKEWSVVRLGEVGEFQYGYTASATEKNTGIKILRISDIREDRQVDWEKVPYCEIQKSNYKKYKLVTGDVLFARIGATSGKTAFIDKEVKGVFASYLIKFKPWVNNLNQKFLYFYTQSKIYWVQVYKNKEGQLKKGLNVKILATFKLPLPPLPEQKKIAEVLSTVDHAIEKVDEAIKKTQRVKKGLMQELFTKGIGHKEFKDTEIGMIPKEWEAVRLGNKKIYNIIMGQSPPSSTYNEDSLGLPFLQGKMEFGDIYPLPITYCSRPIKIAKKNDILISIRAPVGDLNISPSKVCIGRGLASIRCNNNKANYLFQFYSLKLNSYKFKSISSGSTFKAIRKNDVDNFIVPLPPLTEQQKIAEILGSVDNRLELMRKRKEKLERIKKGLMNDLLTGRKRVKLEA